jgi:hypothetical protein
MGLAVGMAEKAGDRIGTGVDLPEGAFGWPIVCGPWGPMAAGSA